MIKRRLIISDGLRERELLLVGTIVVGRDPSCDVTEDGDPLLSRRHTEFTAGPDGVTVRDLGSRNGTFVNGVRIAEGSIRAGDVVHIGNMRLRYIEGDGPVMPEPSPVDPEVPEDNDVTRVIQAVRPTPRLTEVVPVQPASSKVEKPADDEERTVATPQPAPIDDEQTVFVKVPTGRAATAAKPEPAKPEPAKPEPVKPQVARPEIASAEVARPIERIAARPSINLVSVGTYVSVQVAIVAVLVFLSVVAAFLFGRSELSVDPLEPAVLLKWLAVPIFVACVAAFGVSRLIARRIARILTADNEGSRGV
jgi:hypothetical protein